MLLWEGGINFTESTTHVQAHTSTYMTTPLTVLNYPSVSAGITQKATQAKQNNCGSGGWEINQVVCEAWHSP